MLSTIGTSFPSQVDSWVRLPLPRLASGALNFSVLHVRMIDHSQRIFEATWDVNTRPRIIKLILDVLFSDCETGSIVDRVGVSDSLDPWKSALKIPPLNIYWRKVEIFVLKRTKFFIQWNTTQQWKGCATDTCRNKDKSQRHQMQKSIHLYEVQDQIKQVYGDRNQNSGRLWGRGM